MDRDADTRRMYAQYLELSAYIVDEAEDGREALAKAISNHPDIIVTETHLPGMSGYELCKLLRLDLATRETPILVVTADAYEPHIRLATNAGANNVLIKPCLPQALLIELDRLLEQSAALREEANVTRDAQPLQLAKSDEVNQPHTRVLRRAMLSRTHQRGVTTQPRSPAPALVCPQCDEPLRYQRSHIGGVSVRHSEQWDYYECASCGEFQYRQRTRKLRKV